MEKNKVNIFWFRRDLRLGNNKGLSEALKAGYPVLPPTLAQASTLVPRIKECKATTVKGFGFYYT